MEELLAYAILLYEELVTENDFSTTPKTMICSIWNGKQTLKKLSFM